MGAAIAAQNVFNVLTWVIAINVLNIWPSLPSLPFVPFLNKKLGVVNCIVLGVVMETVLSSSNIKYYWLNPFQCAIFYFNFLEASNPYPYILSSNILDGMATPILWVGELGQIENNATMILSLHPANMGSV